VPAGWPSGYYAARFPVSGGSVRNILFVVRAANPGLTSPIAVVSPTNTYHAYNQYGGKSLYDSRSTNGIRAPAVSFNRPYNDSGGLGRFLDWEQAFVDWMTAENRTFEVITEEDLEDAELLASYQELAIVGHSEYWSLVARHNLEAFSAAGGHVAVFGGNTMWFQVRIDAATRKMTCYKSTADPLTGVQNELVTVNWFDYPVWNPENLTLGASFRNAGYANTDPDPNNSTPLPDAQRVPYTVTDAGSWVFDNTSMTNGETFGKIAAGTEVDGAVFNTTPSGLVVDGSDGTPLNLDVLATVPAESGYGTIGIYANSAGAGIFNAGTRDWARALATDPVVAQITRNVLDRFATGEPLPIVPRTTRYRFEELFNTPEPYPGTVEGWKGHFLSSQPAAACAHEGTLGLELKPGTSYMQVTRNFAPTGDGIATATLTFYLNLDSLTASSASATPFLSLVSASPLEMPLAAVELQERPEGRSIRLALRRNDASNARTATSAWIVVPAGWQFISVIWRSGGVCELQIGAQAPLQLANPETGQIVHDAMLEFPANTTATAGSICLDELRLRDVIVAPPSAGQSTIVASPSSISADGASQSTITVQLKNAAGVDLTQGGDAVTLASNGGTLSPVTDHDDGTYSATLTAPTTLGTATITGTVNGGAITDTAAVTFVAGPVTHLLVNVPDETTMNTPFEITVSAVDAQNRVIAAYSGTIAFTSDGMRDSLPANYTFTPSDAGVHTFNGVTLGDAGDRTINIADTADPSITGSAAVHAGRPTQTTLTSSANPSDPGAPLTLTATVTSPEPGPPLTGTVTFKEGQIVLGAAELSHGTASITVSTLGSGTHSLVAMYSGDETNLPSTSAPHTQYITLGPPDVQATTVSTASVDVLWSGVTGAATYRVERSSDDGAFATLTTLPGSARSFTDTTVSAAVAYLYRVVAIDAGGNPGAPSSPDVATTIAFTRHPQRIVRASDVNNLRQAIDVFRRAGGLGPASYTKASITPGMAIRAIDIVEMRNAVNAGIAAAGLPAFSYTDPPPSSGTVIKASDFRDLHAAIGGIPFAP